PPAGSRTARPHADGSRTRAARSGSSRRAGRTGAGNSPGSPRPRGRSGGAVPRTVPAQGRSFPPGRPGPPFRPHRPPTPTAMPTHGPGPGRPPRPPARARRRTRSPVPLHGTLPLPTAEPLPVHVPFVLFRGPEDPLRLLRRHRALRIRIRPVTGRRARRERLEPTPAPLGILRPVRVLFRILVALARLGRRLLLLVPERQLQVPLRVPVSGHDPERLLVGLDGGVQEPPPRLGIAGLPRVREEPVAQIAQGPLPQLRVHGDQCGPEMLLGIVVAPEPEQRRAEIVTQLGRVPAAFQRRLIRLHGLGVTALPVQPVAALEVPDAQARQEHDQRTDGDIPQDHGHASPSLARRRSVGSRSAASMTRSPSASATNQPKRSFRCTWRSPCITAWSRDRSAASRRSVAPGSSICTYRPPV